MKSDLQHRKKLGTSEYPSCLYRIIFDILQFYFVYEFFFKLLMLLILYFVFLNKYKAHANLYNQTNKAACCRFIESHPTKILSILF